MADFKLKFKANELNNFIQNSLQLQRFFLKTQKRQIVILGNTLLFSVAWLHCTNLNYSLVEKNKLCKDLINDNK